jgi:uncharacterized membrane protein
MKHKYKIFWVIFSLSLVVSAILATQSTPPICKGGCDSVTTSKYAYLFGIKTSIYGVFIFLFLSVLTYLHIRNPSRNKKIIINLGIIFGSLVALYFVYLQHFVLKSYCKYCLVIDISLIISLIVLLISLKYE